MTREELIKKTARDSYLSKSTVDEVLRVLENTIVEALRNDEQVKLFTGVTFDMYTIPEQQKYVPSRGYITVPEHDRCKVRLTEYFQNKINYKG